MHLHWTTPATQDLYNIIRRIQRDNPDAAAKVAETLYQGCSKLVSFPRRGSQGEDRRNPRAGVRGLALHRGLSHSRSTLEIVRIYHGAQDWP